jgi:hypothetical protein
VGRVRRREAEAALVEDDPGVARLVAFQLGIAEISEAGGGECRVIEAGVRGEGGGQFADDVAEGGAVQAQGGAGAGEEVEGVGVGAGRLVS